tara:strand:+ start:66 stop:1004 length:939 start_codon:yes stop_codon:yes gene_type:complete
MGLFKKLKKAFKKITSKVKKVVKKVVKGVKKVVKKIGSSKILKAIAIAGAAIVTGGAAIGAFTGGTATGFGGWLMNASNTISSGALFGTKASGLAGAAQSAGNFLTKVAAKPFASVGSSVGNIARGVTDFTGLTDAAKKGLVTSDEQAASILSRTGMSESDIAQLTAEGSSALQGAAQTYVDTQGGVGTFTMADVNAARGTTSDAIVGTTVKGSQSTGLTGLREFGRTVGTSVATNVATGAIMAKITETDPTGTSVGAGGQERAGAFDPLRIYASENNINVSDIYNQVLYGNADPSSMYGSQLYSQETVGVA